MKCIDNYINGNLSDAKHGATRKSFGQIRDALICDYGKDHKVADAIAGYLKGFCSFQVACDAEKEVA